MTVDVCVVGAGPVGIAVALACADAGRTVRLLESGPELGQGDAPSLDANILTPQAHAPLSVTSRRALGGTSGWWGGRCVPLDPIDFEKRPWVPGPGWPIAMKDVEPWLAPALDFFNCGPPQFRVETPGWSSLSSCSVDHLERWAPEIDMARRHIDRLRSTPGITVQCRTTVVALRTLPGSNSIAGLETLSAGGPGLVTADRYVLAGGGVSNTALLLRLSQKNPELFWETLGKYYAGHISGKIADIQLFNRDDVDLHDFFSDAGVFCRRRFVLSAKTQANEKLLNIALWLDNPPFHGASHRNPVLSMVWLAFFLPLIGRLIVSEGVRRSHVGPAPHRWLAHLRNVLSAPVALVRGMIEVVTQRLFAKPRRPGFLLRSADGRYALHYHAEQSPNPLSVIRLTDDDRLEIDFRYSEADARSVVRAHEILDQDLRDAKIGSLHFHAPPEELRALVMAQASDGFHQTGTTRMSQHPNDGVVDRDCRVHGLENLYIAGGSVLPTSGQANPTLPAVMLGLRLADHLTGVAAGDCR